MKPKRKYAKNPPLPAIRIRGVAYRVVRHTLMGMILVRSGRGYSPPVLLLVTVEEAR